MTDLRRISAVAAVAALTIAITSCVTTVEPGPLSIGSGASRPVMVSCASDLERGDAFIGGDRLANDTDKTFTITSVVVNGATGLDVEPVIGRLMPPSDSHFLIAGEQSLSEEPFLSAATGTELEGVRIGPGEVIGLTIKATLTEDLGHLDSVTVTYEGDGTTYRNTSTASFEGAVGACPE